MKKIIAVISCLLMMVCACLFTACGSAYDGNYTQVDVTTATAFSDSVASSDNTVQLDITKGAKISMKMNIKEENASMSIDNYEMFTKVVNGKLLMKGFMKMSVSVDGFGMSVSCDMYHDGNYLYIAIRGFGDMGKMKMSLPFDGWITENEGDLGEFNQDLSSFIEMMGDTGICLIDETKENEKKIRFEISVGGELTVTSFRFDNNYKLLGMEVKNNLVTMTLEGWEGEINLPSDLNDFPIFSNGSMPY